MMYSDDLLMAQDEAVLPLMASLVLAACAVFGYPISWKKLQLQAVQAGFQCHQREEGCLLLLRDGCFVAARLTLSHKNAHVSLHFQGPCLSSIAEPRGSVCTKEHETCNRGQLRVLALAHQLFHTPRCILSPRNMSCATPPVRPDMRLMPPTPTVARTSKFLMPADSANNDGWLDHGRELALA